MVCGDFNACIGSLVDIDIEAVVDSVPKGVILDAASPNTHGKELIEFVRDVGMVVLNGRGSSNNHSFTFISTNGSSVVDYTVSSPLNNGTLLGHSQFYHLLKFLTDSTSQLIAASQTTLSSYGPLS